MIKATNRTLAICLALMMTLCLAVPAMAESKIVDLNAATVEDLMGIEDLNIPEELAKSIVEYREKNGPFQKPEDFLKVPGMTQDFMEDLNPQVKDGKVFYDPDAEPALAPSKC